MLRERPALSQPWVVRLDGGSSPCCRSHQHLCCRSLTFHLPPGLCFTPSAFPEHVFTGLWIPILRGKHKTRLGWFLISTGCDKRTIVTPR